VAAALALLTSVLYGVSNYVGPTLSRTAPLYVVLLAGQAVACVTACALALATGVPFPAGETLGAALLAGVGNGVGLLTLYRAAQLGPLSVVIPIGSLGALVPVAVGIAGGDPAGALKLAGVGLALCGVALAARRPGVPGAGAAETRDARRAVGWAAVSAVAFGVFLAALKTASQDGILWAVGVSRMALLACVAGTAVALGQALAVAPRRLPLLAVPGVLLFGGTLAYAAATQEGDLSVVSVLGSLFPVVTVLLAVVLGGERLSRPQAGGVAAALAGIVLLSAR
jgi:drug/metabolite transporter (DMT)-like permease